MNEDHILFMYPQNNDLKLIQLIVSHNNNNELSTEHPQSIAIGSLPDAMADELRLTGPITTLDMNSDTRVQIW